MGKKKKMTGKRVKIIINIISLVVFCIAYFYLYENYVKKTDKAYADAELTGAMIKDRERKLLEEDEVKQMVPGVIEQKEDIIDSFPVNIAEEDNYMFVEKLEEVLDITTSSVSMSDSVKYYDTIIPAVAADVEGYETDGEAAAGSGGETTDAADSVPSTMTAYYSTLSFNFVTSYEGFKELTEYIRDYPEHTVIDSVTISRDNMTGSLAGSLTLKRFFLSGTGKDYETPVIEGIDIGTDNIFGTEQ